VNEQLKLLFHIVACFCWVAVVPVLHAADKIDFQGLEDFKPLVLTNETLAVSGVDVVTLTNSKTYLLSIGTTANQAKRDSGIRAKLDTRKVAEAKARKTAAEFIKVEVSTEDKLTELRKTEKVSTNEGLKSQVTKLIKVREEIITQKSQVVFAGSRTVATWLSDGGESFNAVVAFEITNKESK
jgi:hypothetical protein